MVNVFGESVGSGFSISGKVVATVGQYEDYWAEINQSYVLGFSPYQVHTNVDGTFVTLIRYYDGRVYVLDDVAMMDITKRHIAGDKNKLVYFVEADGGGGVALQGPSRGLKGSQGPSGRQGPARKRGVVGSEGPPGKIGKIGPPGPVGGKGSVGERGEKGGKGVVGSGLETKAMLELTVKREMSVPKGMSVPNECTKRISNALL